MPDEAAAPARRRIALIAHDNEAALKIVQIR